MKFLDQYYSKIDNEQLSISAEQGSSFAKQVAGDFNPIHHVGAKRFCVPGDLLFAIALQRYGLNQKMAFQFTNLVAADAQLNYPTVTGSESEVALEVSCDREKTVLAMQYSGESCQDELKVEPILRSYVQFSGQNFPHIFVPLMKESKVMINPKRPLVMYQSMSFELQSMDFQTLDIELTSSTLESEGKRGNVTLDFAFMADGRQVGSGSKNLVLSGLREYEQSGIDDMCDRYEASKYD